MIGWSSEVEKLRILSKQSYQAWISEGKPRDGDTFILKKESNANYRYAVRKLQRSSKLQRAKSLFEASLKSDLNLLNEMKKIVNGSPAMDDLPEEVDGVKGEQEIANKFREVHNDL